MDKVKIINVSERNFQTKDGLLKPNEVAEVSQETARLLKSRYEREFRFIDAVVDVVETIEDAVVKTVKKIKEPFTEPEAAERPEKAKEKIDKNKI